MAYGRADRTLTHTAKHRETQIQFFCGAQSLLWSHLCPRQMRAANFNSNDALHKEDIKTTIQTNYNNNNKNGNNKIATKNKIAAAHFPCGEATFCALHIYRRIKYCRLFLI